MKYVYSMGVLGVNQWQMDHTIMVQQEERGYSASIEALHIFTQGDTMDELISNVREAIELHYEEEKDYYTMIMDQNFSLSFGNFHARDIQAVA